MDVTSYHSGGYQSVYRQATGTRLPGPQEQQTGPQAPGASGTPATAAQSQAGQSQAGTIWQGVLSQASVEPVWPVEAAQRVLKPYGIEMLPSDKSDEQALRAPAPTEAEAEAGPA